MDKKTLGILAIVGVIVIVGAVLMVGRAKGPQSDWCRAGEYVIIPGIPGGKAIITGIEKHVVEGKTVELCCQEAGFKEFYSEEMVPRFRMKSCSTFDKEISIAFRYDEETDRYIKVSETYPKDGQTCRKDFDSEGNVEGKEFCY